MTLSTAQTLDHHLKAEGAGDLAAMMEDFAEDAFIIGPDGTASRGLAAIKRFYEASLAELRYTIGLNVVEDDVAFVSWSGETPSDTYESGACTYVMREGKIVALTISAKVTPKK